MFHVGHLHALRRAVDAAGDLIIGVADDELVLARYGREPRVAQPERMEVLTAFFPDAEVRSVSSDGAGLAAELGADTVFVCVPPDHAPLAAAGGPGSPAVVVLPYHMTSSVSLRSTLEPEVLWPLRGAG